MSEMTLIARCQRLGWALQPHRDGWELRGCGAPALFGSDASLVAWLERQEGRGKAQRATEPQRALTPRLARGATLFSGGGGVEARLKDCIDFVHAVKYDPAIAAVYRANHGDHIQVASVCDVDYAPWGQLDYLHASPVCKNASQAKTGGEESDTDIQTAMAVVRCLEATQPRVFTLENVGGYARFDAYRRICQALDRAGYMWHAEVLNAADYGVPQTRRRLILRAVKDALLPGWPAPLPWVGWYAAIEDLIPGLPTSQFAAWQLARLPESITGAPGLLVHHSEMRSEAQARGDEPAFTVMTHSKMHRAFIVEGDTAGDRAIGVRHADSPVMTIKANVKGAMRAFIVAGSGNQLGMPDGGSVTVRDATAPYFTITAAYEKAPSRAFLVNTQHTSEQKDEDGNRKLTIRDQDEPSLTVLSSNNESSYRAWLSQGRVVKMTPRALARFQSLPDSYILPEKSSLACTVIGNMVPSLLMREIVRPLL